MSTSVNSKASALNYGFSHLPGKLALSILAFDTVGSLLVTGFFVAMEMFCRVGDCPSPN